MRLQTLWGVFCCVAASVSETTAQISPFPYSEGFEGVRTPNLPIGWTSFGFASDSATPREGNVCVSAKGNTAAKYLISPAFDFRNRIPDKLIFYERRSNTAKEYRLEVCATLDGVNFDILLDQYDTISVSTNYVKRTVNLIGKELLQQNVMFRWRLLGDSTNNTGILRIDDVSLTVLKRYDAGVTAIELLHSDVTRRDSLTLTAMIKNFGALRISPITVRFFRDVNLNGSAENDEQFSLVNGLSLDAGDSLTCKTTYPPVHAGEHGFIALVDFPDDENRSNDTASISVTVGFARGDLLINEIMYAPNGDEPECAQGRHLIEAISTWKSSN